VYTVFRKLLVQCGIAHAGRGKGPRIQGKLILVCPLLAIP
jgi:hypothetical protein